MPETVVDGTTAPQGNVPLGTSNMQVGPNPYATVDTNGLDRSLTFGEKAVGLSFNPSGDERVNRAQTICAELIDMLGLPPSGEMSSWTKSVFRTTAFNAIIAAQMAVVKLITWKE